MLLDGQNTGPNCGAWLQLGPIRLSFADRFPDRAAQDVILGNSDEWVVYRFLIVQCNFLPRF